MGCYISLHRDNGASDVEYFPPLERSEWDTSKDYGDKAFVRSVVDLARTWHPLNDIRLSDTMFFRPENFEQWRAILKAGTEEGDHYLKLLDIMERDPSVWCFISW